MLLVPLFSAEGKKRLEDVEANNGDYNNDLSSSSASSSSSFPSILASSALTITGGSCYVQKQIITSFRKQRGNTCCGLASLAVLLTAASAKLQVQDRDQNICIASRLLLEEVNDDKHYQNNNNKKKSCPHYVDEDDVYSMLATRTDVTDDKYGLTASNSNNTAIISSPIVSDEKIRRSGMTLDQITSLASALPTTKTAIAFFPSTSSKASTATAATATAATATTTATATTDTGNCCIEKAATADDDNNDDNNDSATAIATATRLLSGPDELRTIICQVLSNPSSKEGLILNYHMTTLGQVPFGGHLSPIAAYHQTTDTVLIMDVWHTKTEPVWATIDNVWNAISISIDGESQKPRGLLLIEHK